MLVVEPYITGLRVENWNINEQPEVPLGLEKILCGKGAELRKILELFSQYESLVEYLLETQLHTINTEEKINLPEILKNYEKQIILRYLVYHKQINTTAEYLTVPLGTLKDKLSKFRKDEAWVIEITNQL